MLYVVFSVVDSWSKIDLLEQAQESFTVELNDLSFPKKRVSIRVLHVDDDPTILEISKLMLADMGNFEIEDACCVDEAFKKLLTKHYDVIVSDYDMPLKDGLGFLKELREQENSIPFILFTGKGREEVAMRALNLGADGYFNKQGDPEVVYGELTHGIKLAVDRQRARRALEESEKRYQTIIEHAVDGILIQSADGKILDANQSAVEMLGYSKQELLSMSIGDIDPNGPKDKIKKMWAEVLEGKYVTFKSEAKRKDGKLLPIEVTLGSLVLGGKRVMIGTARNITEQKNAEEALRKTKERYQDLIEAIEDVIWEIDARGIITFCSPQVKRFWGFKPEEMVGKSALGFILPVDKMASTEFLNQLFTFGAPFRGLQTELCKSDGKRLTVETSGTPFFDETGKLLGYRGASKEITERKKAEEAIRKSEAMYRELANSLPELVFETDLAGKFTFVNERATELTSFTKEELEGKNMLQFVVPEEREKAIENMKKVMAHENIGFHEYTLMRKDETTYHSLVRTSPITTENKVVGLRGVVIDITERKKMEDELRVSEGKLRRIIDASPDSIAISSSDAKIVDCNYAALKEFEYKEKSEVIGKNIFDFFSDKDKATAMQRLAGKNEVQNEEFIFKTKTGVEFPGELSTRVVDGQLGQPKLFVSLIRDVTERKKVEKAVKQAEKRSHLLFDQAPLGFLLIDPETMVAIEFNDRAHEQLGYTREEFAKLRISDYQAVESLEEIRSRIREIIETGRGSFQTKHRDRSGSITDVLINVRAINLAGKKLLLCAYLDVTQVKAVEYALMESESKYRLLVEMAQEGLWALDANNNTVYVNPRMAKMLGYAESEVIGKSFAEFVKKEMDYQSDLEKCAQGDASHCELSLVRKDGERIYANIAASPINDDCGNRVGMLALVADITQRKQAEEKLKESYDKMQIMTEKLQVVGSLTRHDVRNKLSGISGYLYLLKKKHANDPETVDQATKVEQSIREISRIFEFAKSYEQLGVEELVYLDVKTALSEAAAMFSGLSFKVVDDCEGLSLLADSLARQMFYNFLDNTRKYGQKATQAKMSFKLGPDDSIKLIYEDDGVGISAENKLKLFKEGFSTGGGTGFGLFLSRKAIDLYGWSINEVGEPGKGAKFLITIPRMNKKNQPNYYIAKK